MIDQDGREVAVTVNDLSKGGFRISTDETLMPGDRIQLIVEKDRCFQAIVKWALGNEAGGVFVKGIRPEEL